MVANFQRRWWLWTVSYCVGRSLSMDKACKVEMIPDSNVAHHMQWHCRTQSPTHWFHLYSILNSLSILGTPTWLLVIFYGGIHQENSIFRHRNIHDKWSNSSHLLPWLSWGFLTAPLPSPPTTGFPCSSDFVPSLLSFCLITYLLKYSWFTMSH